MAEIDLIGVPFDGYGRDGHQARAAAALRAAGLPAAFGEHEVMAGADLELPASDPGRGAASGLMNEAALVAMGEGLNARVREAVKAGRFPVVYGGDCSALVGAFTGLRDAIGRAGLVFVDGHEDTTPLDVSGNGEGANTEVGLLLGITGRLAPESLRQRLCALEPEALAMIGQRDEAGLRAYNLASLRDRGVWQRRHDEVGDDAALIGRDAVAHVRGTVDRWWLHIDLDVLAQDELIAQRVPGDSDEAGGLNWSQLTDLVSAALRAGGCLGWSVVIYDPDQDPTRDDARRIVRFVGDVARFLP